MASPKFAVGESVILQSVLCPQYNGEYIVEYCKHYNHTIDILGNYHKDVYSYKLLNFKNYEGGNQWVLEQALRKKHKPSEFGSLTNLMNNLKLPQKIPQEVK